MLISVVFVTLSLVRTKCRKTPLSRCHPVIIRQLIELDVWCIHMDFTMHSLSFINSTTIYIIFKLGQIRSN